MRYHICLSLLILFCQCDKQIERTLPSDIKNENITYAKGFSIQKEKDYTLIEITKAFSKSEKTYRYVLTPKDKPKPDLPNIDAFINIPVSSIVVTSTTHIPALELLEVEESLVGFPNTDYISSERTRKLIDQSKVKELGQNESINTEVALDLRPDVIVGFGIEGQNTALNTLEIAGIPIVYNGDWLEQTPLGKAEWIKFFGALYQKEAMADSIFNQIEKTYITTKRLTEEITEKPTVLSGAMYKDIWYLPYGNSWAGQLIEDAGGDYIWRESEGSGSIALNIESVLDKGQGADMWIAPGSFSSYSDLQKAQEVYTKFEAYQTKNIYNFVNRKGATGGLLYYELAPNRPDIVLKDLVYYLHPELLPDYQPYFFNALED